MWGQLMPSGRGAGMKLSLIREMATVEEKNKFTSEMALVHLGGKKKTRQKQGTRCEETTNLNVKRESKRRGRLALARKAVGEEKKKILQHLRIKARRKESGKPKQEKKKLFQRRKLKKVTRTGNCRRCGRVWGGLRKTLRGGEDSLPGRGPDLKGRGSVFPGD